MIMLKSVTLFKFKTTTKMYKAFFQTTSLESMISSAENLGENFSTRRRHTEISALKFPTYRKLGDLG